MAFHYKPIKDITAYLSSVHHGGKFLDVGPGLVPFPGATHMIDHLDRKIAGVQNIKLNVCEESLPFSDHEFDFVYCRHVLEDINNPDFLFRELRRVGKAGYIETPSPMAELTKRVDSHGKDSSYRGYIHHRHIIWNVNDGVLRILPKFPIVEHLDRPDSYWSDLRDPYAWNSYFMWGKGTPPEMDHGPPNYKVLYNDIDYNIHNDYNRMLDQAINEARRNVQAFKRFIGAQHV